MTRSRLLPAVALVGLVLASAGCGSSKPTTSTGTLPTSITIVGDANKMWAPSAPTVRAGEVDIAVTSTGKTHDFVLDGVPGGTTPAIFPGQTDHLHVLLKPGHYRFHCTFHPMMTGMLTVR